MDDWKNKLVMSLINNENDDEILSKKYEKIPDVLYIIKMILKI
jgi:hypothetical protein